MKTIKISVLMTLVFFVIVGCNKDDSSNLDVTPAVPTFPTTSLGEKEKKIYDQTGIAIRHDFDVAFYNYNWTSEQYTTRPVKVNSVDENITSTLIDSLTSYVFDVLPDSIMNHLPLNVLLLDSIANPYSNLSANITVDSVVVSYSITNYIALGYFGQSYTASGISVSNNLREKWITTFVGWALKHGLPYPSDFAAVSMAYVMKEPASFANAYAKTKNYNTSRRKWTPIDYAFIDYQLSGFFSINRNSSGVVTEFVYDDVLTVEEDFGAYVGFILYRKEADKQILYAQNPDYEKKVNLVKEYCKNNLDWDIKCLVD